MITATLRFTGNTNDGLEMYRSYYLVADDSDDGGIGKSSIIPTSAGVSMPESDHFFVQSGGEKAALEHAVKVLSELPANQGLSISVNYNPD